MDSFRRLIFKRFDLFLQIKWILTNPDLSLVHRRTLNKHKSLWILGFGFSNPYWFQKIRFVDSFCRPFVKDSFFGFVSWICFVELFLKDLFCGFVLWICFWKIRFVDLFLKDSFRGFIFERFVSWIRFVKAKIPNYSIRFVSEGFVYESRILTKKT